MDVGPCSHWHYAIVDHSAVDRLAQGGASESNGDTLKAPVTRVAGFPGAAALHRCLSSRREDALEKGMNRSGYACAEALKEWALVPGVERDVQESVIPVVVVDAGLVFVVSASARTRVEVNVVQYYRQKGAAR